MSSLRRVTRWLMISIVSVYTSIVIFVGCDQRSLLYHPTHAPIPPETIPTTSAGRTAGTQGTVPAGGTALSPWRKEGRLIGFAREVAQPKRIWLMLHGNAGQAQGRSYVLRVISPEDSLYVVEYPGFGTREGTPTFSSMNAAAEEAYRVLCEQFPDRAISVIGESMGSGPASLLSRQSPKPDRIVLVVPYDRLVSVAAEKKPYLPVSLMLRDRWDNIASLQGYSGRVDIYGASQDEVIPVAHARNLAANVANARFHEFAGGHNDWREAVVLGESNRSDRSDRSDQ